MTSEGARWAGWGAMLARAIRSIGATRSARQAIERLDAEGLRRALARGADPGGAIRAGDTPLTLLARVDRAGEARSDELIGEMARVLIRAGADPNEMSPWGDLPLTMAADGCALELSRALLEAGANPEAKDSSGRTAAERARDKTDVWQGVDFSMNFDKLREKEPLVSLLNREAERWAVARAANGSPGAERRASPRL